MTDDHAMVDGRGDALAWFNDASNSIAQKVAALRNAGPDVPASVPDVLDKLDRWWKRWEGSAVRDALMEHRGEELGGDEYDRIVMDANKDDPRHIVAITKDHRDRSGRFRLPMVLAVFLELKAQETPNSVTG